MFTKRQYVLVIIWRNDNCGTHSILLFWRTEIMKCRLSSIMICLEICRNSSDCTYIHKLMLPLMPRPRSNIVSYLLVDSWKRIQRFIAVNITNYTLLEFTLVGVNNRWVYFTCIHPCTGIFIASQLEFWPLESTCACIRSTK